jgi:hypothetical protein
MGYDITAYLSPDPEVQITPWHPGGEKAEEIATLERGARSTLAPELFKALHAEEFDGVVSGNAGARWFTRDEIVAAMVTLAGKLHDEPNLAGELKFLATVLERMVWDRDKQYESVFIWFC